MPPISTTVLFVLASATLFLAGCKAKPSGPTGRPTFEAVLLLHQRPDATIDEDRICSALKLRADELDQPVVIDPGAAHDSKITISFYTTTEAEARTQLGQLYRMARLEVRQVHPDSARMAPLVEKGESVVPGFEHHGFEYTNDEGHNVREELLLSKPSEITSRHIEQASPDAARARVINVTLTSEGGSYMRRLTGGMQKGVERLAILVNDEVVVAPVVHDIISTNFIILGNDDDTERRKLCSALMSPLDVNLSLESFRALPTPTPAP